MKSSDFLKSTVALAIYPARMVRAMGEFISQFGAVPIFCSLRRTHASVQMVVGGRASRVVSAMALALLGLLLGADGTTILADEFDDEPINYSRTTPVNVISRLQGRIDAGEVRLVREGEQGYLKSLLRELDVPVSSQMLVFSKTSLQRNRIAPQTPRAIYFNDETYVGYCQHGDVLELSAADPQLGTVFYTLNQDPAALPKFVRQTDECLICHGSAITRGVPGHLVRSVYTDRDGFPILSMGSHRIDQSVSVEHRWGGWYVTGTHGRQTHLGNLIVAKAQQRETIDNLDGQNLTSLATRFKSSSYLSPHSDLVALMVLEHQVEGHNLLTRASFQTRQALYSEARLNRELGEPAGHRWESTSSRIKNGCEALVKYLLFCEEAPLNAKFTGTAPFAAEFTERGPRDSQNRFFARL